MMSLRHNIIRARCYVMMTWCQNVTYRRQNKCYSHDPCPTPNKSWYLGLLQWRKHPYSEANYNCNLKRYIRHILPHFQQLKGMQWSGEADKPAKWGDGHSLWFLKRKFPQRQQCPLLVLKLIGGVFPVFEIWWQKIESDVIFKQHYIECKTSKFCTNSAQDRWMLNFKIRVMNGTFWD